METRTPREVLQSATSRWADLTYWNKYRTDRMNVDQNTLSQKAMVWELNGKQRKGALDRLLAGF